MTTYKNYTVLTEKRNAESAASAQTQRGTSIIRSVSGTRRVLDRWGVPSTSRMFQWTALSKDAIAVMRAFIEARRGRVVPFWLSSESVDFELVETTNANSTRLTVKYVGYSAMVFGLGNGRRHVAVRLQNGAFHYAKINSATENRDGTETLILDSAVPAVCPAGTTVSYLLFCRNEEDSTRISYLAANVAEATMQFLELNKEAP